MQNLYENYSTKRCRFGDNFYMILQNVQVKGPLVCNFNDFVTKKLYCISDKTLDNLCFL